MKSMLHRPNRMKSMLHRPNRMKSMLHRPNLGSEMFAFEKLSRSSGIPIKILYHKSD